MHINDRVFSSLINQKHIVLIWLFIYKQFKKIHYIIV